MTNTNPKKCARCGSESWHAMPMAYAWSCLGCGHKIGALNVFATEPRIRFGDDEHPSIGEERARVLRATMENRKD